MAADRLGIPTRIRLLDLEEQATVPVEMPNGSDRTLHFFDAADYQLFLDVQRTQDSGDALRLLKRALRDAPDAEIALMTPKMVTHVILVAARKVDAARAVLEGNGSAPPPPNGGSTPADGASPPTPSNPPTPSSTPSPGSRKRRGRTGGASRPNPTTAPSSP